LDYCRARRGRRIFACKGVAGVRPIWPGRTSKAHSGDPFFAIGVDTAKDAIYAALRIDPPTEPGFSKPGFIHFPIAENFDPEYFEQLNSERKQQRKRLGQSYSVWVKIRERNEVLDCWVGCLAMRKALPRYITVGLEYSVARPGQIEPETGSTPPNARQVEPSAEHQVYHEAYQQARHPPRFIQQYETANWVGPRRGWMNRE